MWNTSRSLDLSLASGGAEWGRSVVHCAAPTIMPAASRITSTAIWLASAVLGLTVSATPTRNRSAVRNAAIPIILIAIRMRMLRVAHASQPTPQSIAASS